MTALLWIGLPLLAALCLGAGYLLGRRSSAEREMDRLQARELARPRLNPQAEADEGEATS